MVFVFLLISWLLLSAFETVDFENPVAFDMSLMLAIFYLNIIFKYLKLIYKILYTLACKALNDVSIPDPGHYTSTDKVFIPNSKALEAAASAAI